jgi:acyl dehydratase
MIRPTRTATEVKPGDALAPLERTFTVVDLVAYGAATWDWHRLHYDLEYARSRKLPNVIVDGQAFGALFARAALDWAGPQAFMTRLALKMRAMAFAGDRLRAEGEVRGLRGRVAVLAQRLTCGERLIAEAATEIRLPE